MISALLGGASSVLGGMGGGGGGGEQSSATSTATAGSGDFKPDTLSSVIPLVMVLVILLVWVKK
jgi:branched-subunit amino acid ABC-type transport system permease component